MASIYELTSKQKELMEMVESGDISSEDASDTFEGMQGELNEKINDYLFVRRDMLDTISNIDAELERLTALKKTKTNQVKALTERLKNNLEGVKQSKFDTGLFKGHFRKGSTSLKVHKSAMIPEEFVTTSITEKVNAKELKKAIESGELKLGSDVAEIVTGESSLIIK